MKTNLLPQNRSQLVVTLRTFAAALLLLLTNGAQAQKGSGPETITADKSKTKTIMLVTGAFVSNNGWNEWKAYYESKGYRVVAPAWPHKKGNAADLRLRQPDSLVAQLSLNELVDYHVRIIDSLGEKPIIIGHSFGGLITQLLVQKGKAATGVAYHSVAPQGVFTLKYSFIKSLWGPLGLFESNDKTFLMSFPQWQYAFTNGMKESEQKAYYDQLVIPESRNVMWDGLKKPAAVDFKKAHAPLLFVSGSEDHIMPATLNKKTYKKYFKNQPAGTVTEYKEFAGKNHLAMAQPNWQEEADYILEWAIKHQ